MELGLTLQLAAPPVRLPRGYIASPCAPVRSGVRAGRHESRRAGAVSTSGGVSYAVVEDGEVNEGEEMARPRLELTEKLDRCLALLDEYESEELGAALCANHRSARLVGMVSGKAERNTDVSFALDDGTGHIDFIRWLTWKKLWNKGYQKMENQRMLLLLLLTFSLKNVPPAHSFKMLALSQAPR
ncbi:hypothetical protein CFC21_008826 [Triticum aestivum]|uniref:Uncharacterized protein n=2 Tax=Triticum aestivum TaxID=4565 RepID=A0A3B5Z3M6_WHEAT|nr:hypothetical protein CFC21_008826 [Triticum aestivum]